VKETDARAILKAERVDYWLGVGALPSEKVAVLIKKYGTNGSHVEEQKAALARLSGPKTVPDAGAPASLPKAKADKSAPPVEAAGGDGAAEAAAPAETGETANGAE
jgi:small subunit ribosomal protein S16